MAIFKVPDLGGASDVEVIEILVSPGDAVSQEQPLIVLETDKASMEIPADADGVIDKLLINVGDKVNQGDDYIEYQTTTRQDVSSSDEDDSSKSTAPQASTAASQEVARQSADTEVQQKTTQTVAIPDLGGTSAVTVIEICVVPGDRVAAEDTLVILESDKATMDIPSPLAGEVSQIHLQLGDQVSEGDALIDVLVSAADQVESAAPASDQAMSEHVSYDSQPRESQALESDNEHHNEHHSNSSQQTSQSVNPQSSSSVADSVPSKDVYAGPVVRMLARELGVDLALVKGTGRRQRITKDDVHQFVKQHLQSSAHQASASSAAMALPKVASVDHSQFGEVSEQPLNAIKRATAAAMTTAMLNVPQVTHFDQAAVDDLESFRQAYNAQRSAQDVKLSLVPLVIKALAVLLDRYPAFKASLSDDGQSLIHKHYCHIGVAVNTDKGLLVPVIRNVDQLGVRAIAEQLQHKAQLAREGKLSLDDMQGGCFTVSSLGGIGGSGFTPIVNPPQVAILGLSVAAMQPTWNGEAFVPKLMLPLSLSYDHRVVDGAEAAEFSRQLAVCLEDVRRLLL